MSIFYRLLSPTSLGEFSIVMRGEDTLGTNFFVHNEEVNPMLTCIDVDVDLNFQKFEKVQPDFLQTTWGIPLFSQNFVENAPGELLADIEPILAKLHLRGGRCTYFAAKTKKYLQLVDLETSRFSNIRGIKILTKASFNNSAADNFLLARDAEFKRVFVATESLISAIKDRKFNVEFLPY
ncbi:hypothetical protein ECE50_004940 [Chitinophaga sp. Mgbs1]|uniref:Uncharacterized protein n=1 Tax=Chitinophaga solisilvae TaxID=1233460 RepID=A0A433WE47_9BACT|nr:hypothetical protein [Chitinophaga solisilvae]